MTAIQTPTRYLISEPANHLIRPVARLQPVLAKEGKPSVNLELLAQKLDGCAWIEPQIAVQSPEHWTDVIANIGDEIDGILPVSIPALPTEIWNSHPQPLVERGLPFIFWCLIDRDEPDFWRWSARDFLSTLGVEVHLVKNNREGEALVRALSMRRFLRGSKIVVIGEQNFPWNANAIGDRVMRNLGTEIVVRSLADVRSRYGKFSEAQVQAEWQVHQGSRYVQKDVRPSELEQAVRSCLAIEEILQEEHALGFGVNCFGELVIQGGRDVPCLAQEFLREKGYIASCDGDFIAMMSMALTSFFLDAPCMMSNMYPISYQGALEDHFGDPLKPDDNYPQRHWTNMARLNHCGFVGVVPPEMTTEGKVTLRDWGGTSEVKRDGRGCGIDANLAPGEITVIELCFDAHRLLVTPAWVLETTRHPGMPHCESSALLQFRNLPGFIEKISREHTVIVQGDHIRDFEILAQVLGLECIVV